MTLSIAIMYGVAAIFTAIGVGLLAMLTRRVSEQKVYAFRMIGIMALALGVVLLMSATAMWHWSVAA
jgi:multidrug transporter EmrE-like cation transporter